MQETFNLQNDCFLDGCEIFYFKAKWPIDTML